MKESVMLGDTGTEPWIYSLRPTLGYLAVLGRISKEKRVDHAIEITRAVGVPLKIAANVDPVDVEYSKSEIQPLPSLPADTSVRSTSVGKTSS
jgi:hypothetical protein